MQINANTKFYSRFSHKKSDFSDIQKYGQDSVKNTILRTSKIIKVPDF